ncbi:hypothetical protein [Nostoc sp.]|uniref:hypothetical protein n=1 Tax=Nostoc sp. TaxID=1180 RepID=UPI002FF6D743
MTPRTRPVAGRPRPDFDASEYIGKLMVQKASMNLSLNTTVRCSHTEDFVDTNASANHLN